MKESETRKCHNCGNGFTIEPDDFQFYEKIKVPAPTWCPECRLIRRLMWREERTLYRRPCSRCGKETLSTYAKDAPFNVYCTDCYYSDVWDPMAYGKSYDFGKPFFEQFRDLLTTIPRPATTKTNSVGCDYSHGTMHSKNCYFVFNGFHTEDSMYSSAPVFSKNILDSYLAMNVDQGYELVHVDGGYRLRFAYYSDECLESSFLYDCRGCSDCFGSINLRNKQYHFFNRKLSKSEYQDELKHWDLGSYRILNEARKRFDQLLKSTPNRYAFITNSVNVTGNIIKNSKNSFQCFSALGGVENCKYVYFGGLGLKDSYDVYGGGDTSQLLYETVTNVGSEQSFFSARSDNSRKLYYSEFMKNCSDCFGCIALSHKHYCILNKQYSKEEYLNLVSRIVKHMNDAPFSGKLGRIYRFGDFFPSEISPYGYNESAAQSWFPLTKEQALNKGYTWKDGEVHRYTITLKAEELPDHIKDVSNDIINQVIGCTHASGSESAASCGEQCITAFRITKTELEFYRSMNLALPRLCPNCRHYQRRSSFVFPMKLYRRKCSCRGATGEGRRESYANQSSHFHGQEVCPNDFETAYVPDRPEIVYCQSCYKEEFL